MVIVGDTVIGRGDADINLDYFNAFNAAALGVSRRHLMLRPSETQLYLIDMESTNGTLRNGQPMSSSNAYPITSTDVISLGLLNFTLYIQAHVQNKYKDQANDEIVAGDTDL